MRKEDLGTLMANTGGDFDWWQDGDMKDEANYISTTLAVLMCQLILPNCFAVAFWFPVCAGFVLSFWIASRDRGIAISVRSACGLETQYCLGLWYIESLTSAIKMSFSVDPS